MYTIIPDLFFEVEVYYTTTSLDMLAQFAGVGRLICILRIRGIRQDRGEALV